MHAREETRQHVDDRLDEGVDGDGNDLHEMCTSERTEVPEMTLTVCVQRKLVRQALSAGPRHQMCVNEMHENTMPQ